MLNQTDKTLNKKNLMNFKSKFDNLRTVYLKKEYSVESKNKKDFTNVMLINIRNILNDNIRWMTRKNN